MSALVGVSCDGPNCQATYAIEAVDRPYVGPAREQAKDHGWHRGKPGKYVAVNGKEYGYQRDICPVCWKAGHR